MWPWWLPYGIMHTVKHYHDWQAGYEYNIRNVVSTILQMVKYFKSTCWDEDKRWAEKSYYSEISSMD